MFASTSIALSAFADDHGGDSPDYLSPFNVIGTKADVSELKGSGAVLDSSDLKPFMHTDIHEILRQVPGVYVRGEEGYGFFPNISLRGVDPTRSRKTPIMEDEIEESQVSQEALAKITLMNITNGLQSKAIAFNVTGFLGGWETFRMLRTAPKARPETVH